MLTRLTAVAALVVLSASLLTGAYQLGEQNSAGGALPEDFNALEEAYVKVATEAVRLPDGEALAEGAIEGMLGALGDPYAAYYDAAAFAEFNDLLDGEFSGVGLVLEETPEGLTVVTVLPDTPAAQAGIEVGERIVSVDGRDVRELPADTVVELVKGEEGTQVTLGLEGGAAGARQVTLVRQRIMLPALEAQLLPEGVGHVRLLQFSEDAAEATRDAVEELRSQGARGIVLDLRGNPGGLLREAVDVASVFIEDGTIVSVRERAGDVESVSAQGDAVDIPLVVLVDEGSASASEIVAGAVQDLERGPIVGTPTFGKGTVQTVEMLRAGGGIKFTTAEYLTPSGTSIEGKGVVPDEIVEEPEQQLAAAQRVLQRLIAGSAS